MTPDQRGNPVLKLRAIPAVPPGVPASRRAAPRRRATAAFAAVAVGAALMTAAPGAHAATLETYVANSDGTVTVIDANHTVTGTINVGGSQPQALTANPALTELYEANYGSNTVSVISAASHTVIATITGITNPYQVAFDPTAPVAYVVGAGTVTKINTTTHAVIGAFTGFQRLSGVAVEPDHSVLVCDYNTNTLFQLNPSTGGVERAFPTGANPYGLAAHLSSFLGLFTVGDVYVANRSSNTVTALVYSGSPIPRVVTIPVGAGPSKVVFSPNGQHAYVVNLVPGTVSIIDVPSNTVIATASAGLNADNVATYWGGVVYVTNYAYNTVTEIDSPTGAVTYTIPVGPQPAAVAIAD